jgi:hypothetical protein
LEQVLLKLDDYGKDRIQFSDFTNHDKNNLLEVFLLHETTLKSLTNIIFNKKDVLNPLFGIINANNDVRLPKLNE